MTTPADFTVRFPVDPPPAAPRPFGLLSVAVEGTGSPAPVDAPARFERGVDYYSPMCNMNTGSLEGWCPEDQTQPKQLDPFAPVRVEGRPFTVTSGVVCVAPTFDAAAQARAQLERGEAYRVESHFFAEQTSRPDVVTLADEIDIVCAVGALEAHAARTYGGRPVLHVPLNMMPRLFADQLVDRVGDHLETRWGTLVAAGAGYPQTDPAPLLITGQVTVWRTEPIVNDDFNVRANERLAIAERTYVLTADCMAAVVTVPGCPGGIS